MKTVIVFFVFLMTSNGGGCEGEPFKYVDNSRIILETYLVNENMQPLPNQLVTLYSDDYGYKVIVKEAVSDKNGKLFLTAPRSNNPMYIKFNGKDILFANKYNELLKENPYDEDWIGFFSESYYDFGTIGLKNL